MMISYQWCSLGERGWGGAQGLLRNLLWHEQFNGFLKVPNRRLLFAYHWTVIIRRYERWSDPRLMVKNDLSTKYNAYIIFFFLSAYLSIYFQSAIRFLFCLLNLFERYLSTCSLAEWGRLTIAVGWLHWNWCLIIFEHFFQSHALSNIFNLKVLS